MKQRTNNQSRLKFCLKLWRVDGTVKRWHSSHVKRIYSIFKAEKFLKAYVKVVYGKAPTADGKIEEFYNDGIYETLKDLRQAFKAFTE